MQNLKTLKLLRMALRYVSIFDLLVNQNTVRISEVLIPSE
jgi:hypothetical protein